MHDFIEREIAGLVLAASLFVLYLFLDALWTFLDLFLLTLLMVLLTSVIAGVIIWEEWVRPKQPPLLVEAVDSEDLDEDEDFAFNVENVTGSRISGGSRVIVMPRNLKQSDDFVQNFRFPQTAVNEYLHGNRQALDDKLISNSPMYCFAPASQTGEWRGPWATYLAVAGGDKRKKISTKPFQIYNIMANTIRQKAISDRVEQRIGPAGQPDREAIQRETERVEQLITEIGKALKSQVETEHSIQMEAPETLAGCIFPTIRLDDPSEVSIELRNIARYNFEKEDGDWTCVDYDKIKSD